MLNPIHFLIGAERSGTTLLRLMLDHHPEIAWSSEFTYAVDQLPPAGGFPPMSRFLPWLEQDRTFRLHSWSIDRSLSYPELMDSFLRQKRGGKKIIGATVHRHYPRLLRIWPHARFLYLVRDGRDVAKSRVNMGWAGNTWTAIDTWIEAENLWKDLRAALPPDRWLEVRYESLVADPAATLSSICRFLGTGFHPAMFDYVRATSYGLPDPKLSQQWRSHSPQEIRQSEAKAGALLIERQYPLSGLPPLKPTPLLERQLWLENRRRKFARRIRQYGWRLAIAEIVFRKLRLRPLQARCRARMDEVIDAHLKR